MLAAGGGHSGGRPACRRELGAGGLACKRWLEEVGATGTCEHLHGPPLVLRRGPAHWGLPSAPRGPPRTQASTSGPCSCSSPRCRRRRLTGSTPSPSARLRSTMRSSGGRPGGGRPSGSRLLGGRPQALVWAQASHAALWSSGPCGAEWDGKGGLLEEGRGGCVLGLSPGYLLVPGRHPLQTSRRGEEGSL